MRITTNARATIFAFLTVLLLLAPGREAFGQVLEDLRLFGYFQGRLLYSNEKGVPEGPEQKAGFTLQQLNFMFAKDFGSDFSAFGNIEMTNSFSTENTWGSLKLEEAWMRYNYSSAFNVKVGLQIPIFNNLNEIKNRTPLLPYVGRPSVYETAFSELLPISVFVPQQAFFQIYGALPVLGARVDYAAYVGNQDAFITSAPVGSAIAGSDTTTAKLVGGRLGLRYKSLKAGVSGTIDHDNLSFLSLGEVNRRRLGADLSFTFKRFFFEGELIAVLYDPTELQQATLTLISLTTELLSNNLDKLFYYALVGYHVTDQWFVYAYHDYLEDNVLASFQGGYSVYSVGGGYKPIDPIVVKLQYIRARTNSDLLNYRGNHLFAAVSVLF